MYKRIDFFLNLIFFSKSENIFLQGEGGMWAILLNDCTKDIITWLAKLYMQELIIELFWTRFGKSFDNCKSLFTLKIVICALWMNYFSLAYTDSQPCDCR